VAVLPLIQLLTGARLARQQWKLPLGSLAVPALRCSRPQARIL